MNPLSELKNVASRLVNALVKALNSMKGGDKLPKCIVVVPDWDLARYINYHDYDVHEIFTEVIEWIIINMKRAVESKKDFLMKKKAGAIATGEPKFLRVKMISRYGQNPDRILGQKGRFNRVLEDLLADQDDSHHIMDVNVAINDSRFFTPNNQLNAAGEKRYWEELIEQLQLFDFNKLKLKPLRKEGRNSDSFNRGCTQHRDDCDSGSRGDFEHFQHGNQRNLHFHRKPTVRFECRRWSPPHHSWNRNRRY